ncbi:phage virion morphogenesis protein [Sodalis sp.]|uniref:phage virion morphogenesis protein n=1 Tax=Sodalis sp. (in: enterobacteria) TaxID=1898979 RepID=UPI003873B44E
MGSDNALLMTLERELKALVATATPRYRRGMARKLAQVIRLDQQKRIRRQQNPDGSAYIARRRRLLRAQQGIRFLWKDEVRTLKNWRASRGLRGRTLTGFDEARGAVRSFYRHDITRYLDIQRSETRHSRPHREPMFRRLRTGRFLRATASPSAAVVGFQGRVAALAREHQYGLTGSINALARVRYPQRELLGLTAVERTQLIEQIYQALLESL